MGTELNCLKDLASVSIAATELSAVDEVITNHLSNPIFMQQYNALIQDITNTFQVVLDNLTPIVSLHSRQQFEESFDHYFQIYADCYLKEISKPRVNAELTYEKYLQFRKLKEVNTGFPLLKRNFTRLHDLIDKWLDNDIWLAMYIDSLFKMFARLLNEVNEIKKSDVEDAYIIFHSGLPSFGPYLDIISTSLTLIAARR